MGKLKKAAIFSLISSVGMTLIGAVLIACVIVNVIGIIAQSENNNEGVELMESLPPWVTPEIILTSLQLQDEYGIYASVTIAQAQQEVGGTWDGTSLYPTASIDYNLFGLKASNGISEWNGEITWDGTRGGTGTYRKYDSYSQGLKDRARLLLSSSAYSEVADTAVNRRGSQAQLEALSRSPWCENQYHTLNGFMEVYQLRRLDNMTEASYRAQYGTGGNAGAGQFNGTFVYYNQADPAWGSLTYVRGDTIASSGCAATSLAMIWATYKGDTSITPATVFSLGNGNGALVNGWLSRDGCVRATNADPSFGCTAVHKMDWQSAYEALDRGGAVMVVGSGQPPFTSGGHWFVIIGYEGNKAYLADPGHRSCTWTQIGGSSNGESLSYIRNQTQDMIIFTPR